MREIKFRGISIDSGDFVYGDFVHYVSQSSFPGIVDEDGFVHEIYRDSCSQLVGYDKRDGSQVYEGDVIHFTPNGEPLSAQFAPCLRDKYLKDYFDGGLIQWHSPPLEKRK